MARDRKGWPARLPSPGHGRPVQLRFETELTAEEYVSREEWRNASFPPCLKGRDACDCGLMRHGTYGRKTPIPMRVARFDCRACQTTISRLPDFAAARRRGSLQEIEDAMMVLAAAPSRWAAARCLFPDRDELANAIRDLLGAFMAVSFFLEAVATLRPDLFRGTPADLVSMRAVLGMTRPRPFFACLTRTLAPTVSTSASCSASASPMRMPVTAINPNIVEQVEARSPVRHSRRAASATIRRISRSE